MSEPYTVQAETLLDLPANWDGYGADRVSPLVLDRLMGFLNSLQPSLPHGSLVPGADGSVQYEYHGLHFQIEICAEADLTLSGWLKDRDFSEEFEAEGDEAVGQHIHFRWATDSRPS